MTPEEFYDLDEREQNAIVLNALPIAERYEGDDHVLLYQIGRLYIEAYYHAEYKNIRKFQAFTRTELLDIYLNEIPLDDVL